MERRISDPPSKATVTCASCAPSGTQDEVNSTRSECTSIFEMSICGVRSQLSNVPASARAPRRVVRLARHVKRLGREAGAAGRRACRTPRTSRLGVCAGAAKQRRRQSAMLRPARIFVAAAADSPDLGNRSCHSSPSATAMTPDAPVCMRSCPAAVAQNVAFMNVHPRNSSTPPDPMLLLSTTQPCACKVASGARCRQCYRRRTRGGGTPWAAGGSFWCRHHTPTGPFL